MRRSGIKHGIPRLGGEGLTLEWRSVGLFSPVYGLFIG